jgi:hypothetical protein
MFAKLAQFARWHGAGTVTRPQNDNHPLRLVVGCRPPRRSVLTCRWQKTPSGRLECVWGVEAADATAPGKEPQLCPLGRATLRVLLAA